MKEESSNHPKLTWIISPGTELLVFTVVPMNDLLSDPSCRSVFVRQLSLVFSRLLALLWTREVGGEKGLNCFGLPGSPGLKDATLMFAPNSAIRELIELFADGSAIDH